mgnify:CR=1 FL=1
MPLPLIIAGAGAAIGAVSKLTQAAKQNKLAKKINPIDQTLEASSIIGGLYGQGKQLYQGRMAGATQAEQNISTGEANATAFGQRNATDASQLLSLGASVYGQGNEANVNLATQEAQDKQQRFGIYSQTAQLAEQDRQNVYNDKLRKYYDDLNYKRALEGAAMQNKAGAWNSISEGLMSFGTSGLLGGGETNASVEKSLGASQGTRVPGTVGANGQINRYQNYQGSNFGTIPFNPRTNFNRYGSDTTGG